MIENRQTWLEAVLKSEGGYVNHPLDKGGPTNFGITLRTLSEWRKEECTIEDVVQLTEEEACDIYMSAYWQVMRGDQLPGGVDLYACDFAVNSGPARAAKILQELVDTKADTFVGPKTIEAVRKQAPLQLLLAYHGARMKFLLGRSNWDAFGRGWTNRCSEMLTLAQTKIAAKPGLVEAAGSKIIKTNAPTAVAGAGGLAWAVTEYGPIVLQWMRDVGDNPDSLERLQSGVQYINTLQGLPVIVSVLGGLLLLSTAGNAAAAFWRWRMFKKGEV
jgi:lysozyme family protein